MERYNFGRSSDNDIVLDDKMVSRDHGYLLVNGNKVYVVDNDSTNGIYVNGKRIQGMVALSSHDRVTLAKKIPLDWKQYVGVDEDETVLFEDETIRGFKDNIPDSGYNYDRPLIDIPSRMEINQNHAEVYRNGDQGADWKVPLKRNVGNAVGKTLGCVISVIIVLAILALVGLLFSN